MRALYGVLLVLILLALGGGGYYLYSQQNKSSTPPAPPSPPVPLTKTPSTTSTTPSTTSPVTTIETGVQQKKTPHFIDASPAHNEVYAAAPMNVTINFDFDLGSNSTVTVEKDGTDYGTGDATVDTNKRTLRRKMKAAPDGVYTVKYKACWPDKTCHDGQHAFTIDKSQLSKYTDMTGKTEVKLDMKNTAFSVPYLVVSKGTKVTWTNMDATTHYVNADTHPSHTFLLALNSEALAQNGTFSYTFADLGEYPYHCSAHAAQMMGRVVVK